MRRGWAARRSWPTLLGALVAVLAATTALASIGPAEPAFPVAAGPGFHRYPDIAAQPGGSYTVVWEINDSIRSRRYGSDDQPLGGEKLGDWRPTATSSAARSRSPRA